MCCCYCRHGAHNWEGPGALTAMTALEALAELTQNKPWLPQQASSQHVIYAGKAMTVDVNFLQSYLWKLVFLFFNSGIQNNLKVTVNRHILKELP